jgi:hypothetical protein
MALATANPRLGDGGRLLIHEPLCLGVVKTRYELELLLAPISIFASLPILGLGVAGVFVYGSFSRKYKRKSKIYFALCSVMWMLFTALNFYLLQWRSSTGDMAIRIDLVLFGPIMIFVSVIGFVVFLKGRGNENT